ncbi:hypothetical protein JYU34_011819 [Plutella xylostella]|uniref:Uncharacterized protein n=1 Tax=Plutella xylostella TaxID=51655 RepID=A0ABQ7QEZ0_PLUXY|nr:hypothetical protein JYU34_011819 [Plutella xylostella]
MEGVCECRQYGPPLLLLRERDRPDAVRVARPGGCDVVTCLCSIGCVITKPNHEKNIINIS